MTRSTWRNALLATLLACAPALSAAEARADLLTSISGLEAWFKADSGVTTDGNGVTTWTDQSGNGRHATRPTGITVGPSHETSGASTLNGMPTLRFLQGTHELLTFNGAQHLQGNDFSFYSVLRPEVTDADNGFFLGSDAAGTGDSTKIGPWSDPEFFLRIGSGGGTAGVAWPDANHNDPSPRIAAFARDSNDNGFAWFDGAAPARTSGSDGDKAVDSQINRIGGPAGSFTTQGYGGTIGELIFFDRPLNAAERTLVDNYLSAKYNIPLATGAGASPNVYTGDNTGIDYDLDVFGVGQASDGSSLTQSNAGGLHLTATAGLDNGDFLMAGHNSPTNGITDEQMDRVWFVDLTDAGDDLEAVFTLNFSEAGVTRDEGKVYALGYNPANPDALEIILSNGTVLGDEISFSVNSNLLQSGYFGFLEVPPLTPEPSTIALFGIALAAMAGCGWYRRQA